MTGPRPDDKGAAVGKFFRTIMVARRYGKATATKLVMQPYLDRGDHVHEGNKVCYNGDVTCLPYVDEQKFTGPDTPKEK